jgi:hsp70-interacting protein
MPDLNELLKWSILNSASGQTQNSDQTDSQPSSGSDQQLSLRFNPATTNPSTPSSALHPNDPQYRIPTDDVSPASTPGPTTPSDLPVPLPRQVRSVEESNAILEMLMGKPDSTTMREKLEYAQNEDNEVEKRIEALDDFEMVRWFIHQGIMRLEGMTAD